MEVVRAAVKQQSALSYLLLITEGRRLKADCIITR